MMLIREDKKIALVSLEPFMVRVFDRVINNENKDESKKEMVVDLIYNQQVIL